MHPTADTFRHCLAQSERRDWPYAHWLLDRPLPLEACDAVVDLPFKPAVIEDTHGKRETHNALRCFFNAENRARFPVCESVASALQSPETVALIERTCDVDLTGTYLRIEYCQDTDGFWLEPHTDIGVKKYTMLIYLSQGPGSENWGTDVLDADHNLVATAPCRYNSGLIFVPGDNTWHGFHKRPIDGVRRSLIVNFVTDEWRNRHELCYPDAPIAT